jgi:hypothetical protein
VAAAFLTAKTRQHYAKRMVNQIATAGTPGEQIHALALRESRSQSSMISVLVAEALAQRRSATAQVEQMAKLTGILRGEVDAQ